jgi:hypothetical protein
MDPDLAQLANDRYEIGDALHRYAFALDHNHADTLASILTEDCRFDFRPAGRKLGLEFSLLAGREEILNHVLPRIGPLQTSHTASNIQIEVSGDSATLSAYMMSQHFMPLNDPERGKEFALLMNRYDCDLVRASATDAGISSEDRKWRFRRITIDNAWFQGDPEILNVSASYHALRQKRTRPNR